MPCAAPTTDDAQVCNGDNKSAAWYTAFYYLAEHVREATLGAVNHKGLYAFIGPKGRYINHSNPMVRKRTAGTLSRIVHTKRYAQDMRNAYLEDDVVFEKASKSICEALRAAQGFNDVELREWIVGTCWPDVRCGLVNEAGEWRHELNPSRLDCEMSMLFASCQRSCEEADSAEAASREAERAFSAMLHVMAFDHLEATQVRLLVDQGYFGTASFGERLAAEDKPVYLIRFADSSRAVFSGIWRVSKDRPFVIGRYTDCDAFELSEKVSRVHCQVLWKNGIWYLEDLGSRNGSLVHREDARFHVAKADGAADSFRLEFGDAIELPDDSVYSFVASIA